MAGFSSQLDNIRVAAPCLSNWNQMAGDERVRFCKECSLNVYNLTSMTRREAERLISNAEGRLCIRYYRRRDGTILTRNCPVGLSAIKRRVSRTASAALSAVLSFFAGMGIYSGTAKSETELYMTTMGQIAAPIVNPSTSYEEGLTEIMGDFSVGQVAIPVQEKSRTMKSPARKAKR